MKPVALDHHNFTYKGPTDDIGDLSCYRDGEGGVLSHWRPSSEELTALEDGGLVELGVYSEPIPPVSVNVFKDGPVGVETQTTFETVKIDGEVYRVPQAVVKEIEVMRDSDLQVIRDFQHDEDDTIVVTFPEGLSPERVNELGATTKAVFPTADIAVMPESIGLHTQEKLSELLNVGADMVAALNDRSDPIQAVDAIKRWNELTGA